MERQYMIATHGELAAGFQSSLNVLAEKGNEIEIINAYITDEDYTPKIVAFIDEVPDEKQAVIFTDLFGGSVNQKVVTEVMTAKKSNVFVVSNANLAIVLSIIFLEEPLSNEKIEQVISECQVQLVQATNSEEEAFF
ncbi:hypothetical protein [Enterococcus pallens]|uniref:PTS EIIA type-4 domain-containing protein n=1 Tax=Enterococcus pallens ATCC BAA-351 TaxID=1158607 RepID=R2SXS0_9ENTE|nr:hypothetical protein [Enterococcus pallens]EOH97576.1 hypothetical protein UAU_00244 [Enterococcus pallens ATCC BAA-351]EOU21005.1 hypothetical protein I588_01852 [Enterococcus pallens ATCC BAA-351]